MKKVVLSLALVAMMSVSFVSCKETAKEETTTETTTETVEETAPVEEAAPAADTVAVDSTTTTTTAPAPAH